MLTSNGKAILTINNECNRPTSGQWHRNTGDYDSFSSGTSVSLMLQNMLLHVGTGTSEPKSSDIALTNRGAGLTVVSRSGTNTSQSINPNTERIAVFTATYKNNTSSNITVTECGVCSDLNGWYILFARELFEVPITIAPGETYTFSMWIG